MNRGAIEPVLDVGRALEFLGHDRLLLEQVARAYAVNAQACHSELSRAIAAGDSAAGRRILHRVLPTVRLVGCAELVYQGEQLQSAWQAGLADCNGEVFLHYLSQFNRALIDVVPRLPERGNASAGIHH